MRLVPDWWIQTSWWASGIFATGAVWYFLSAKEYPLSIAAGVLAMIFAFIAILLHRKKDAFQSNQSSENEIKQLETEISQRIISAKRKAEGNMLMHYTKTGFVSEVVLGLPMANEAIYEKYKGRPLRSLFLELKSLTPSDHIEACLSTVESMSLKSQSEHFVDRPFLDQIVAEIDNMLMHMSGRNDA